MLALSLQFLLVGCASQDTKDDGTDMKAMGQSSDADMSNETAEVL